MGKRKGKAKLKAKVTSVKAGSREPKNIGGIMNFKVVAIAKSNQGK